MLSSVHSQFTTIFRTLSTVPLIIELPELGVLSPQAHPRFPGRRFNYDFDREHLAIVGFDQSEMWQCWIYSTKDYQLLNSWALSCDKASTCSRVDLNGQTIIVDLWDGYHPDSHYYQLDGTKVEFIDRDSSYVSVLGLAPLLIDERSYETRNLLVSRMDGHLLINNSEGRLADINVQTDHPITCNFLDRSVISWDIESSTINIFKVTLDGQPPQLNSRFSLPNWKLHYVFIDHNQRIIVIVSPGTEVQKLSLLIINL